jgi:hypothetical protein
MKVLLFGHKPRVVMLVFTQFPFRHLRHQEMVPRHSVHKLRHLHQNKRNTEVRIVHSL